MPPATVRTLITVLLVALSFYLRYRRAKVREEKTDHRADVQTLFGGRK